MPEIDNKVVSISFNNKQFLKDVESTIDVIEELNEATSGKRIDSSGIENLGRAFRSTADNLSRDAQNVVRVFDNIQNASNLTFQTGGIDALRKALENTGMAAVDVEDTITSLQQLSKTGLAYASDLGVVNATQQIQNASSETRSILTQDIDDVSNSFSALEMIGVGAMIAIGEKAAELGANALRSLTSGIRNGWGEYNALTNSTQTILVNTQRWGSTMEDVSSALEELNEYADMTTYSFSDMTRNIGYFTTAGVNLEDSVNAIRGLSNVGAMFGADAQAVARAGYQISQAMSAGVIKLMDWKSMINAGMGGQVLQDELIRTAAVMSGTSVDAMNEYIESLGGFNASLQEGWLTSDIFLEAMKTFAGQSREYYESLTDANGNRLYTDEEIDGLVELGEMATESATKVKTLQQMLESFSEAIGSGWQRTFTMIIGNLEEAKEFWTPINNILTSMVDGFFELQNGALAGWRALGGREELIQGILNILTALNGVLSSIGNAFLDAFGGQHAIGNRLYRITEAITDFTESLILSEEEMYMLRDFFGGLLEPIRLILDVVFELVQAFFNAGDAMNEFSTGTESIADGIRPFRTSLLAVLGYIGNVLKTGAEFIRKSKVIKNVVQVFARVIKTAFGTITNVIAAPFVLLYNIWQRYNITEKLDEFAVKAATFFLPFVNAIKEVKDAISDWYGEFEQYMAGLMDNMDPVETFMQVFEAIKQLFVDIFDPTVSLSQAFSNFFDALSGSNIAAIFEGIQSKLLDLWSVLKETTLGQWFEDLGTKIQNAAAAIAQTSFGQKIIEISNGLKEFLGVDTDAWTKFWEDTKTLLTEVADSIGTGWEVIKNFFSELGSILLSWFGFADGSDGTVGDTIDETIGTVDSSAMDSRLDTITKATSVIGKFCTETSKAIVMAEKAIPDPSSSTFLGFLSTLPSKISELLGAIGDGSIIERVGEFFSGLLDSIRSFFTDTIFGEDSSVLSWLAETAQQIGEIIATFLGIKTTKLASEGVFGVLGSVVASLLNTFSGINAGALKNVTNIVRLVASVITAIIGLKIGTMLVNLTSAISAGAKGWANQQAAKKLSAIASVLQMVALTILAIGAVIALLVLGLRSGYGKEIGMSVVLVTGFLVAMFAFVSGIENAAKDIKPGSLTGLSKVLSKIGKLILTVVISIVALIGVAYLVSLIYEHSSSSQITSFNIALGAIAVVFGLIAVGVVVLMNKMMHWANVFYKAEAQSSLNAVSGAIKSISDLLTSVVILILGMVVAITAFSFVIQHAIETGTTDSLIIAGIAVAAMMAAAGVAIFALIRIAKNISSGMSGIKPSDFKKVMMVMSGLLVAITLSMTLLITAVAVLAAMLSSMGVTSEQMRMATGVVITLLLSVFFSIWLLSRTINSIAGLEPKKVWTAVGALVATVAALGIMVGALAYEASTLTSSVSDITTLWNVVGTMGAILLGLIAAMALIGMIIERTEITRDSWRSLGVFGAVLLGLIAAMSVIAYAMSQLASSLASSGFLNAGGSIAELALSIGGLLIALTIITGVIMKLSDTITNDNIGRMFAIAGVFVILAAALGVISFALTLLVSSVDDIWELVASAAILGVMFAGITFAVYLISKFAEGLAAASTLISAAAAISLASVSLMIIAGSLSQLADIDTDKLLIAAGALGLIFVIMSLMTGLLASIAIGTGGLGAVVLLAVAASLIGIAYSFQIFANAIKTAAEGVNVFSLALTTLGNVNLEPVKTNIEGIAEIATSVVDTLVDLIPRFGAVVAGIISAVISGIMIGLVNGFSAGVQQLYTSISETLPIITALITTIGVAVLTAIHNIGTAFIDMIAEDFGEGGRIRTLASSIGEFVTWLSGKAVVWGMDIVESLMNGLIFMLSNQQKMMQIALTARMLYLMIKDQLFSFIGIDNLEQLGSRIVEKVINGIVAGLQVATRLSPAASALSLLAEELGFDMDEAIDSLGQAAINVSNNIIGGTEQRQAEISQLRQDIADLNNMSSSSSYNPTDYYRSISDAANEATESSNGLLDVMSSIADRLGLSGGLSGILGNIDLSSLLGENGLGGLSGLLDNFDLSNLLGTGGLSEGLSSITNMLSGINLSLPSSGDGSSPFSGLLDPGALDQITSLDGYSPVITPDVDTSNVALRISDIEDMFNNANINDFALDVGNSLTVGEYGEGDASTSGDVSYSYTQINYSNKDLTRTELYLDNKNLLRGYGNFRLT